jgi:hypothetical protein
VPLKVVSRSLQAVMDMNGVHLPRPFLGAGHQQGNRVGAAAERNGQWQPGEKSLSASDKP